MLYSLLRKTSSGGVLLNKSVVPTFVLVYRQYHNNNVTKCMTNWTKRGYEFNVIHIPRDRLAIQCLIKQTAQSMINNQMSLMSLLHVSTSASPSSGRYIQRHTSTANSATQVRLQLQYNIVN